MKLARRVRELERAAREKNLPPTPPPVEWRSEGERLRCMMELLALGTLRLENDDAGVYAPVHSSTVDGLSTEELLSILGFRSVEAFARFDERLRAERSKPYPPIEEQRRRVIESLPARRDDS